MADWETTTFSVEPIGNAQKRQFRCRTATGAWITSKTKLGTINKIRTFLNQKNAKDVYYSTSSWLDPTHLPRLREQTNHYPILLDHDVVFDIDISPFSVSSLERARRSAVDIYEHMISKPEYFFHYAAFSGNKGFHLVFKDLDREKFGHPNPKEREEIVRNIRKTLVRELCDMGLEFDHAITPDTRRILRVPGTFHGSTGWACTILSLEQLHSPVKRWIRTIERKNESKKLPKWAWRYSKKSAKKQQVNATGVPLLQVSSKVVGTKNRHCLALRFHDMPEKESLFSTIFEEMGVPSILWWKERDVDMVLIPLALEQNQFKRWIDAYHQTWIERQFERLGHYWIDLPQEPEGIKIVHNPTKNGTATLLSAPHYSILNTIEPGVDTPEDVHFVGDASPSIRIAVVD